MLVESLASIVKILTIFKNKILWKRPVCCQTEDYVAIVDTGVGDNTVSWSPSLSLCVGDRTSLFLPRNLLRVTLGFKRWFFLARDTISLAFCLKIFGLLSFSFSLQSNSEHWWFQGLMLWILCPAEPRLRLQGRAGRSSSFWSSLPPFLPSPDIVSSIPLCLRRLMSWHMVANNLSKKEQIFWCV